MKTLMLLALVLAAAAAGASECSQATLDAGLRRDKVRAVCGAALLAANEDGLKSCGFERDQFVQVVQSIGRSCRGPTQDSLNHKRYLQQLDAQIQHVSAKIAAQPKIVEAPQPAPTNDVQSLIDAFLATQQRQIASGG